MSILASEELPVVPVLCSFADGEEFCKTLVRLFYSQLKELPMMLRLVEKHLLYAPLFPT